MFDVSDPTMTGFNLVFGTTVDSAGSIVPEVVSVDGSTIILDISSGYGGDALYYFEDTSAGMGHAVLKDGDGWTQLGSDIVLSVTPPKYSSGFQ